jgi:sulfur-oxidizing protein SoxX
MRGGFFIRCDKINHLSLDMKAKTILISTSLLLCACASVDKPQESSLARGKKIAVTFELGNCLACHIIADGDSPGNIGPELKSLPTRFKDKAQLREFIWDASVFNPNTSMPPFGKNQILTNEDIEQLVDYLWSL